jgi:hypothetical protein
MSIQSLPKLTMEEWQMILGIYDGSWVEPHQPLSIATDIMDDKGAISLTNLTPEYAALAQKMHSLSQAEQLAIMDFVQKYWANDGSEYQNWDEIYQKVINL